jgi:hypothetical protein
MTISSATEITAKKGNGDMAADGSECLEMALIHI